MFTILTVVINSCVCTKRIKLYTINMYVYYTSIKLFNQVHLDIKHKLLFWFYECQQIEDSPKRPAPYLEPEGEEITSGIINHQ